MSSVDELTVAGAMSGTSADGVDVAIVRVTLAGAAAKISHDAIRATLIAHRHHAYDGELRQRIFRLREGGAFVWRELASVGRAITLAYVAAVHDAALAASVETPELHAVAAHGQTFFHDPPDTVQWLDPALLAAEVGCPVVSDFRRADCAAGGQGAPLVPFADHVLFRHPTKSRVLLNLGGIANLTVLRAGGAIDDVIAFDTGPANCISDWLVRAADPAGPGYDAGGRIAAGGMPVRSLLQLALQNDYFTRRPPKSTDGPAMIDLFRAAQREVAGNHPLGDLLMTACLLTATTVADAVRRFCQPFPDELIVSGGGAENETIMRLLRQRLGDVAVMRTDDLGVPGAAKEAIAFAILGAATLRAIPANVPSATGAARRVILGSVTPRPLN